MRIKIAIFAFGLLWALASVSCGNIAHRSLLPADSVKIASTSVQDKSSFKMSNGEKCDISIRANIAYPEQYKDSADTRKLQQLYASIVLEAGDSISIDEAIKDYASAYIDQNAPNAEGESSADIDGDDYDAINVESFDATINIIPIYNKKGVVTFCKEEIIKKNNKVTLRTHHYYNIDLEAMAQVVINRLFKSSSINDLCQLMKEKLMQQNNVKTEDELNELGYYNLPNLSVANNFFFTNKGITWSFEPNELAINAVGEPQISLDFDTLKPYYLENSIINNL